MGGPVFLVFAGLQGISMVIAHCFVRQLDKYFKDDATDKPACQDFGLSPECCKDDAAGKPAGRKGGLQGPASAMGGATHLLEGSREECLEQGREELQIKSGWENWLDKKCEKLENAAQEKIDAAGLTPGQSERARRANEAIEAAGQKWSKFLGVDERPLSERLAAEQE